MLRHVAYLVIITFYRLTYALDLSRGCSGISFPLQGHLSYEHSHNIRQHNSDKPKRLSL